MINRYFWTTVCVALLLMAGAESPWMPWPNLGAILLLTIIMSVAEYRLGIANNG